MEYSLPEEINTRNTTSEIEGGETELLQMTEVFYGRKQIFFFFNRIVRTPSPFRSAFQTVVE